MSNINFSGSDEQLFNELTPEQSSVIEGGGLLYITGIQAIHAGADTTDSDDTYITVNGRKIWGDVGMSTGQYAGVELGVKFDGSAAINLFDYDDWFNGADDSMGGFTVSGPTNGPVIGQTWGGGSTYNVYYQVY